MNRLIFFTATLSLVFTIANTRSVSDIDNNPEISEESTTNEMLEDPTTYEMSEDPNTVTDTTYNSTDVSEDSTKLDLTNNESTEALEYEMATEMADMITYMTKSMADRSKITENLKSMSNQSNIDEASMKNLVNHLVSFKEDDSAMEDQIKRVKEYRQQFKSAILKYLKNLPLNTEDAQKMEKELRNQMNQRLPNIPTSEDIMDIPASMQNILPN
ncbi:uncharacterized protein LOC100573843 precursor [Acyrthosiphon pisum]|uniref:ACYPI37407 protein n=1 Tax=Acyrthosiphon pisum TaxID=7029 RepID=C4WUI8_ACYPI|nr:uncharacterized protein LOC100573843 precursor [Acyrthosiphon pisum]BAH71558.1 ACYPI37407 [Acyrthosiphon pisum]BAH71559.1 ACYPI37407 [Acyrthosiphon pisum]BAH71560.1 ACYPI37407 [Acyrthosiphon pisum]BAH71561.1 ACYPI37407 [Acyrthosiphon pisum]|eukprot:NP_001233038.1 uncharacterized protein LOC100573843 precursor [Acyrthosiphon pisum]